jgi:hypothetical protein
VALTTSGSGETNSAAGQRCTGGSLGPLPD